MTDSHAVTAHYTRVDLLARLDHALREDGADPARPSLDDLAPYDHFHGRGIEATAELGRLLEPRSGERILDVGSGLGGPARFFADRYGCHVTGVDLTPEFCDVARTLTHRVGFDGKVEFHAADALALPFPDATFDAAYSMNVSMNIADKAAFYRSIRRVLKPGGRLVLSEITRGPTGTVHYPTPWAATAEASFLSTREETQRDLIAAGYDVLQIVDTSEQARAYAARSRALVERGEKPPHRAVILVHGDVARDAMANSGRGLRDGATIPIEVLAKKRD